jgi:hypothetical protein
MAWRQTEPSKFREAECPICFCDVDDLCSATSLSEVTVSNSNSIDPWHSIDIESTGDAFDSIDV